jgi:hypothetical protein
MVQVSNTNIASETGLPEKEALQLWQNSMGPNLWRNSKSKSGLYKYKPQD